MKTMEDYLNEQETQMVNLRGYRLLRDEAELDVDSIIWQALKEYMASEDAKATLADKAAKADTRVQEAKRKYNEADRNYAACVDIIKLCQNKYEMCKIEYKFVDENLNRG